MQTTTEAYNNPRRRREREKKKNNKNIKNNLITNIKITHHINQHQCKDNFNSLDVCNLPFWCCDIPHTHHIV